MKKIYIDFDDVLCETAQAIVGVVDDKFGIKGHYENITDFNLQKSFQLTDEQFKDLLNFIHEPDFIYRMQPIQGACEGLATFKEQQYQVCIMTGRPPSTKEDTLRWLKEYQVSYDSLTFVDKYARFVSDAAAHEGITLEELKRMSFDCAIEDSGQMALYLAGEMGLNVLLHDRPWNRFIDSKEEKIHRCTNWKEILEKIEALN